MTLPQSEVSQGLLRELEAFEQLVRTLDADALARPSRCAGWTVGDVAAHVIGTMADIVSGRIERQGEPDVTERQVRERRGRSGDELADELGHSWKLAADLLGAFDEAAWAAEAPGGYGFTLGHGIETLWYDAYVHGDDIRAALGRASERGDGLRASVHHLAEVLTQRGWGPATLVLDGMPEVEVGGGGRRIEGDPLEFVLAATGRVAPGIAGLDDSVNVFA